MLIREMAFIFRKSKKVLTEQDVKEIVKEDNYVRKLASVLTSDFLLCR